MRFKISPDSKSSAHAREVTEPFDQRMIALMRLTLAPTVLLVIYLVPAEHDRFVPSPYVALILYFVYSLTLFAVTSGRSRIESLTLRARSVALGMLGLGYMSAAWSHTLVEIQIPL